MDGALYMFIARDCENAKMLRFETSGWCPYCSCLFEGGIRWRRESGGDLLIVERRQFVWELEGLDIEQRHASELIVDHVVLWS